MDAPPKLILTAGSSADAGRWPGAAPRTDIDELARRLPADVLYADTGGGLLGRIDASSHRFGYWRQAVAARRRHPPMLFSLSEKVAMAAAALNRGTPHVAIAHNLMTPARRALQRRTGWLRWLDRIVVLSRPQARYLEGEAGVAADRVRFVHYSIDEQFFVPQGGEDEGYVLSVGQGRRDFGTLIRAANGTAVDVKVVVSSRWAEAATLDALAVPPNISILKGLSFVELRTLYDRASVVVVALEAGVDFAAGVNAVLEAMAMAKPLVVTVTPGIADYVDGGVTALAIPPGEPDALRDAIEELRHDRQAAAAVGTAGRRAIEERFRLDRYVDTLVAIAAEVVDRPPKEPA